MLEGDGEEGRKRVGGKRGGWRGMGRKGGEEGGHVESCQLGVRGAALTAISCLGRARWHFFVVCTRTCKCVYGCIYFVYVYMDVYTCVCV